MSKEDPDGITLEDLLLKLISEIEEKTDKIKSDTSDASLYVQGKNDSIVWHLSQALEDQRSSYRVLERIAPNEGPLGKPRIGNK